MNTCSRGSQPFADLRLPSPLFVDSQGYNLGRFDFCCCDSFMSLQMFNSYNIIVDE
jgi:hypothetical protein